MPETPPPWMELCLDRFGDEIRLSAQSSRGERTEARTLGAGLSVSTLRRFADAVQGAAVRGQPLGTGLVAEAQTLHRALLEGEVGELRGKLHEAAGGRLLVRLTVRDRELQALPWEAACEPGSALGFWGSAPDLLPVRGAISREPWQPREVRGAVRVLAIAPEGGRGLAFLQSALAEPMASGEVEWLEPIEGRAAQVTHLFNRLRREPMPHVLHFLGHGHVDAQGRPLLRLADRGEDEERWLPVELLARHLQAHARGVLRLVVLEACEGAAPSVFASAAETLAQAGADAVLAHLWPVKAEVARVCSAQFYRAFASTSQAGDVAHSLNEARRAMLADFESSAEAFSPVLYLRAPDSRLFDFRRPTNDTLHSLPAFKPSMNEPPASPPVKIVYIYAHEDDDQRIALEKHLAMLMRLDLIQAWKDQQIEAGQEWQEEKKRKLAEAELILLLVSSAFMTSDPIWEKELEPALERAEQGGAVVVPILVRPVAHLKKAKFMKYQALPSNGTSVVSWKSQDEAWVDVATGLGRVVESIQKGRRRPPAQRVQPPTAGAQQPTRSSLRKLIGEVLPADDLDAFCLDHFPLVKNRFYSGMSYTAKVTLLLENADADEIFARLREDHGAKVDKVEANKRLLRRP